MLLKEKEANKKAILDKEINSTNLDVAILSRIMQKEKEEKTFKVTPNKITVGQLAQILKNKNNKLTQSRSHVTQTRQWLQNKGIDLRKISNEINENKRIIDQYPPSFTEQRNSFKAQKTQPSLTQKQFQFTPQSQIQFVRRQPQIALNRIILNTLKSDSKNQTRQALIAKIRGQTSYENAGLSNRQYLGQIIQKEETANEQKQCERKRNIYFDFVNSVATTGFNNHLEKLKSVKSFWRVVVEHVKTVQHYAPQLKSRKKIDKTYEAEANADPSYDKYQMILNSYLMMKSLKQIEREFAEQERRLFQSSSLRKNIAAKVLQIQRKAPKLKVYKNEIGQPVWAIVFWLVRAGKLSQLRDLRDVMDSQLLRDILIYQESLADQLPKVSPQNYQTHTFQDSFYSQLIYIIKGITKFDVQVINVLPQGKVWALLRILGVHRKDKAAQEKFKQIVRTIFTQQSIKDNCLSQQRINEYLLLGAYEELIDLFQNQLPKIKDSQKTAKQFNYDDYFHLLTVFAYFPELEGSKKTPYLQEKYPEILIDYIKQLRTKGYIEHVPQYLLLCPPEHIERAICSFICTKTDFDQFDWKRLRLLMNERDQTNGIAQYAYLQKSVIKNLQLNTFMDYVFVINEYSSQMMDETSRQLKLKQQTGYDIEASNQKEIRDLSIVREQECYVKALLKYLFFTEKKKSLLSKGLPLNNFHNELFRFFQLSERDRNDIQSLNKKDQFIKEKVAQYEQILQDQLVKCFSRSSYYLNNIILPFTFYRNFTQLISIQEASNSNIKGLSKFNPFWNIKLFSDHNSSSNVTVLLTFLSNQELHSPLTSLYIYYLNNLILKQRRLSSFENDYYGLLNFLKTISRDLKYVYNNLEKMTEQSRQRSLGSKTEREMRERQQTHLIRTNPLRQCQDYKELAQMIEEYLNEYDREGGREQFIFENKATQSQANRYAGRFSQHN